MLRSSPPMGQRDAILSRANPLLQKLRALKKQGATQHLMLIEGPRLLEEAIAAGVALVEVVVTLRFAESRRGRALLTAFDTQHQRVRFVSESAAASLSDVTTHQGVLALARRPEVQPQDATLSPSALVLVAVALQNPGNLGSLLRTAEAAGATGVFLTAGSADPLSSKALRGAMGSAFRLPHVRGLEPAAILRELRSSGIVSIGTVTTGGTPYDRVDFRRPIALWLGNEGAGLPAEVVQAADEQVTIPMAAGVASLNVAVAAGILLFEAARQRRAAAREP
jgi:TrmH family RNA methyltransferase